jgi:hypothetical protein
MTQAAKVCDYLVECLKDAPDHFPKETVTAMMVYIKVLKLDFELSELEDEVENDPA